MKLWTFSPAPASWAEWPRTLLIRHEHSDRYNQRGELAYVRRSADEPRFAVVPAVCHQAAKRLDGLRKIGGLAAGRDRPLPDAEVHRVNDALDVRAEEHLRAAHDVALGVNHRAILPLIPLLAEILGLVADLAGDHDVERREH